MAKKSDAAPASCPSPPAINNPLISELCSYVRPSSVEYGTAPELEVLYQGPTGFYVPPMFGEDIDC